MGPRPASSSVAKIVRQFYRRDIVYTPRVGGTVKGVPTRPAGAIKTPAFKRPRDPGAISTRVYCHSAECPRLSWHTPPQHPAYCMGVSRYYWVVCRGS
jgi:hypothetical protein